jgi:hypothetical protein
MEPIIYTLPEPNKIIESTKLTIYFDIQPSPKLIKYGFNNISDQFDLVTLTSTPYYKAGVNFDFDRGDENSISVKGSALFQTKKFDANFAQFWEILIEFNLLNADQHIYTNHSPTIKELVHVYKQKYNPNTKFTVTDINQKPDGKASIVIYKYSDIDIDENAAIQFIINKLPTLLAAQSVNATLILQLFALQTQTTVEIINYLCTLYKEKYLVKPIVSSELSDNKYIVLIGLRNQVDFVVRPHPENVYLTSIGLGNALANDFVTVIQCMNSDIIPLKFKKYHQIKEYLDTKVYEGATYQELIQTQNANTQKWLEIFLNPPMVKTLVDESIARTSNKCMSYLNLDKLII